MSKTGIKLHPQHGVNPTLGVCFWCGEEDGTVVLLGAACKEEAPRQAVCSMEPCPKCKENMARGITVIECTQYKREEKQVEMQPGAFPTGRWCVLKRESGFFNELAEPTRTTVLKQGVTFMTPEDYERFGFHEPLMEHPAS